MLNELDKELKKRGHRFVRYADDLTIFVKSQKSAKRTLTNICLFIENKLFLIINEKKTATGYVGKIKFLGFGFYVYKGETRFRVHPKAIKKMKSRVKELTARSQGISNSERPKKLGIEKEKAWEFANTRKGYWRIVNSPILKRSITNDKLSYRDYQFFFDYYKQVRVN